MAKPLARSEEDRSPPIEAVAGTSTGLVPLVAIFVSFFFVFAFASFFSSYLSGLNKGGEKVFANLF
jgi:hypothetical protein